MSWSSVVISRWISEHLQYLVILAECDDESNNKVRFYLCLHFKYLCCTFRPIMTCLKQAEQAAQVTIDESVSSGTLCSVSSRLSLKIILVPEECVCLL